MKITVAGVGYVGLSLAVLLSQHHEVTAITTTEAKAEKLNQFISPIQDQEIERFFEEARSGKRTLHFRPELLRQVPNLIGEISSGEAYRDVVCLADVSGQECELYHDLGDEHILLRV